MSNPIIEFYEYYIHDFNSRNKNIVYKFGDFTDADDKCGKIGIEGSIKENTYNLSSCDPLESLSGGNNLDFDRIMSSYDIDNLYGNYKNFFVKYSSFDILNKQSIENINNNIDNAYDNQKKFYNNTQNNISSYFEINDNETNIDNLKKYNNNALILKLQLKKTDKIILIGDLHGSFHTFFRILCRLHRYDILNLETFELNSNYKIIFLGDILDRGEYSLDIIYLIFKLMNINNTNELNVIYNRGNHETYNIFYTNGSSDEFIKKFGDVNNYNIFIMKYLKLLNILPSAILLEIDNKFIWCCHGGFPRNYIDDIFDKQNIILIDDMQMSMDIKWSDFGYTSSDNYGLSNRGDNLLKYSYIGTNKFMNTNKIDFIIRGHQDSFGNSVLFKQNGDKIVISKSYSNIDGLIYNNFIENRSDGAIARLDINNMDKDLYKVLTISTNSDKSRYLQSDSFALLRFDITNNISEFKNCLRPLHLKKLINLLNNNSSINKSDIIINNLNTINDIIDIIIEIINDN
jgi:hypothetical protein